jgi:hypothetical protein
MNTNILINGSEVADVLLGLARREDGEKTFRKIVAAMFAKRKAQKDGGPVSVIIEAEPDEFAVLLAIDASMEEVES